MLVARPSHDRLAAAFLIVGLPGFVLLTIPNLINQAGMLDPFVYTGYIHGYHELLDRFGRTYYSTRIAFIHPARALIALFGEPAGYVALRYVALVTVLGSIWSIAHRFYGTRVAVFSLALFAFNPVLLRSLLWDYVDGFAIAYLLAGAALLIGSSSGLPLALQLAAGVCLALATNCHPIVLAIGVLFLPSWLILQPTIPVRRRAIGVATVGIGFLATTALLGAVLYFEFPTGASFYDSTSLSMAIHMLTGGAAAWYRPLSALTVDLQYYILMPVFYAVLLAIVVVKSRPTHLEQPRLCAAAFMYIPLSDLQT